MIGDRKTNIFGKLVRQKVVFLKKLVATCSFLR